MLRLSHSEMKRLEIRISVRGVVLGVTAKSYEDLRLSHMQIRDQDLLEE